LLRSYGADVKRKIISVCISVLAVTSALTAPGVAQAGTRYPDGTYVVEFDGAPTPVAGRAEALRERRARVLDAIVPGVRPSYEYNHVLNGVAIRLTGRQAVKLAATPGVKAVTPNRVLRRNDPPRGAPAAQGSGSLPFPDIARYLGLSGEHGLWAKFGGPEHAGEGMIIGVLDHGVDPATPALAPLPEPRPDAQIIAGKWRGTCDDGAEPAHKVTCNNKVIGAAWFQQGVDDPAPQDVRSSLDVDGHGTHTASTAAGDHAVPAAVPGTRFTDGLVSGVAPAARIAAYKVCWSSGCPEPARAAAVDRAVADGIDVITMSVSGGPGPLTGPFETAVYNATKAGVLVVGAAGNDGPNTVHHVAPWMVSVAAAAHDTDYRSTLVLGDGRKFTGVSVGAAVARTGLVDAANAVRPDAKATDAQLCLAGTLDPAKVTGKIVVCERGVNFRDEKSAAVKSAGGVGMVVYNAPADYDFGKDFHSVPTVHLSNEDGLRVKAYAGTAGAVAELGAARAVRMRAPEIVGYSGSGPDPRSNGDLLKPDVTAPTDVIAGWTKGGFQLMGGTSAATPHIGGIALLLRALHPDWSPVRVKSALMTSATTVDNEGKQIRRWDVDATPLDYGAGHVAAVTAADPGLVYDSSPADWTAYMCALGDRPEAPGGGDACAGTAKPDPSDLNYPALAVGDLYGTQTLTRTVTNVDAKSAVYRATVTPPSGFTAKVSPTTLILAPGQSATYRVRLERTRTAYGTWSFGSLTWRDQHGHDVRSPIAVRAAQFSAPSTLDVTGESGETTVQPHVGWTGKLVTRAALYAGRTMTGRLTGADPDEHFEQHPHTSAAVVKHRIHVPAGAAFTRVATFENDHVAGSDLDLYAFLLDGSLVDSGPPTWAIPGLAEHIDLPPGDYDVYVVQYELPEGVTAQDYRLWSWQVGGAGPDAIPAVTPRTKPVRAGDRPNIRIDWHGLRPAQRYVGLCEYGDGRVQVGRTVLTATTVRD
jgi:hypothetical protein